MEEGDRERPPPTRQPGEPQHSYTGQAYNPYQTDYSAESQPRPQSFNQPYPSNLEYNIPQSTTQPYAPMQSYPPRQNAAIEVLASQFSGSAQYYVPGEPSAPVPPPPSGHHQQQPPSQFPSPSYNQYSPANPRVQHPYAPNIPDLNQPPPPAETTEETEFNQQHQAAALDEAYARYQTALKSTFQNMRDGRLVQAGDSLLAISNWLLSNAVELVRDEQELHGDRTRLWNEFNTCWLSVLHKEKEMLREYIATGQPPQPPRDILREDALERMGRELVRLCDNMERHGLVDYQMGVWEEEIIEALTECLDLLESMNPNQQPEGALTTTSGP